MQGVISVSLYLLRLALCPKIWCILEKVPWAAEKMYIVLLLDELFCRHQLGPFELWYHLALGFLCWFFCLDDLCISDREVLKSPTTAMLESIYAFKSFSICLMKLCALTHNWVSQLGAYMLIIVLLFAPPPFSRQVQYSMVTSDVGVRLQVSIYGFQFCWGGALFHISYVSALGFSHLRSICCFKLKHSQGSGVTV
jgi:hypothetical protein